MALKFLEGFEVRQSITYLERLYETATGSPTFNTPRKGGTASMRSSNSSLKTYPLVAADSNTWVFGFGHFMETASATNIAIFTGAGVEQIKLLFAAGTTFNSFTVSVVRGATTLATTAELKASRWHFFEFKAVVRTGINGSYELRDAGVNILSASGVNTADSGGDGASVFRFNSGAGFVRFDDIYVCDDTGGIHDDFLGDKVVLGSLPNGDGASIQWLPSTGSTHFNLVDDTAATPNDADYVSSNTDTDLDLYEFVNLTALAADGTLDAVVVFPSARMFSSGARGLKVRFRNSGAATGDSAQFDVTSKSIRTFVVPFDEDPAAVAAWTKAALDDGQLGILNVTEV